MKTALKSFLLQVKSLRKRTWVICGLIACAVYFSYQEPEEPIKRTTPRDGIHLVGNGYLKHVIAEEMLVSAGEQGGSVYIKDGEYAIDTTIIYTNSNKKALLAELDKEELSEKNTVEAIPYVIRHFLDSIAANGKFDIADPNEKCQDPPILPGKEIPSRKLMHFSLGEHIALLSFSTTGPDSSQHVAIIKFRHDKVLDLWFDNISSPSPAKSRQDILNAIMHKCS